jgi:hypothetical protein
MGSPFKFIKKMGLQINTSPDITFLEYTPIWDIAGLNPIISITNNSAGSNLAGCTWWFVAYSPSLTLIHEGSASNPDITGTWATTNLTDNWPRPFNQIEFSGNVYSLTLYVKDSAGNIYSLTKTATICRPTGNTQLSKNPYGVATLDLKVKCEEARIFFQDTTNRTYRGLDGTRLTSTLKVVFPIDETGNIPDPFVGANFSTALVPISYSSDNYQYVQDIVYDYEFDDLVHIRIRYQSRSKNGVAAVRFPVLCNIDLCPLVCEVTRLVDSIEQGTCADADEARRKLTLINPKLMLAQIGKQEPLCGIDISKLIEEIKEIGGFSCDCCDAPTGIIPSTASVIDGYTFEIVPVCGDIDGSVTVNGTNIQFNLEDKSYVFEVDTDSPQDITAFSIVPETNGCTKTYKLQVDGSLLAEELLNIISVDGNLVNLFNSIVTGAGGLNLTVDGGCIFTSTSTCDYSLTLSNIPINTTFALLSSIKIGSSVNSLSFAFNLTNLAALQTYLNGLGYGTFSVSNPSGQDVLIESAANPSDIQNLIYKISSTSYQAALQKDCTGYVAIDANEVVQNIINYLCEIDDSQVVTSQEYIINYIDSSGVEQTTTITAGSTLADLLDAIIDANNNNVDNLGQTASVTCDTLKDLFTSNTLQITANDFAFITKGGGACAKGSFLDIFNFMLSAGINNATTKELFCAFVSDCGAGLTCEPYQYFEVVVTNYDTACSEITGIEFLLS